MKYLLALLVLGFACCALAKNIKFGQKDDSIVLEKGIKGEIEGGLEIGLGINKQKGGQKHNDEDEEEQDWNNEPKVTQKYKHGPKLRHHNDHEYIDEEEHNYRHHLPSHRVGQGKGYRHGHKNDDDHHIHFPGSNGGEIPPGRGYRHHEHDDEHGHNFHGKGQHINNRRHKSKNIDIEVEAGAEAGAVAGAGAKLGRPGKIGAGVGAGAGAVAGAEVDIDVD